MKKRWMLLALLIVGLLGSLEAMPRVAVLRFVVPAGTTCPCNPGPLGASMYIEALSSYGYETRFIAGLGDLWLLNLTGVERIVYLVIAPTNLTEEKAASIIAGLEDFLAENPGLELYLAVFDEYASSGEQRLIANITSMVCPRASGLTIASIAPSNPEAVVRAGNGVAVATGYTSYISLAGTSTPAAVWTEPSLGSSRWGYTYLAAVYPAESDKMYWSPLAAYCRSGRGGVLLVADSSIIINEALQTSDAYSDVGVWLFNTSIPGPALIIVDESLYVDTEASVTVRMHPSFLLLSLARSYSILEERLLSLLDKARLSGLIVLLAATLLLLSTWAASNAATGLGGKRRRRQQKPKEEARKPTPPRVRGTCTTIMRDLRARGIPGLVRGVTSPYVREEAERLLEEVISLCRPGYTAMLGRMLLGWDERARKSYALLLSLLGLRPASDRGLHGVDE